MTQTTHRPSFKSHCDENSFYSVSPDGFLTFDGERMTYCPDWLISAIAIHDLEGSHPDCIICQANARNEWEAEVDAQAADARDYAATIGGLI